jgi:hypothetical protein
MGLRIASVVIAVTVSLPGCQRTSRSIVLSDPPADTAGVPSPAPTPAPGPTPTPPAPGCGLPHGGGSGGHCPYLSPVFVEDINRAIAEAQNEHPELFNFNDGYGGLSYRVLDRQRYYDVVQYNLERMGYCAKHDLEEIGVKNDNRFNEQYQIMTSFGYSRWGAGSYRSSCFPPWF